MSCQGEYENISKLALRKFKFVKDTVSHQLVVMAAFFFDATKKKKMWEAVGTFYNESMSACSFPC